LGLVISEFNNQPEKIMNIELLAATYAIIAEIEGMKAENMQREQQGHSIAYSCNAFMKCAEQLNAIVEKGRRKAVYKVSKTDVGELVFVHEIGLFGSGIHPDGCIEPCIIFEREDGSIDCCSFLSRFVFVK
jgi:hypothetical protein